MKLVGGAITILKNMKVNGKDDIPYIMENNPNVPNHQPVKLGIVDDSLAAHSRMPKLVHTDGSSQQEQL